MTRVSGRVNGELTIEGGPRTVASEDGESMGEDMEDMVIGCISGEFLEREVDSRTVDLRISGFSSANPGKYPL